ncbi:hypothetical protein Tco_1194339 [Tanacetum coccineum]
MESHPVHDQHVPYRKNLTMALHEKKKTAHMLIPSVRFVGKDGREIFGMPIPDALLTNEIKGAPYYSEYQEHVTKYQQYLDAERGQTEEGGATESPKATKVTKPKAAKAGLEGKRCKVKSPLKLVDEPSDECVLGPSRPVILRERDFGKFQPLPERRTHMPIEPSGYAESPSLDAEPALTDSEMESNKEVPEINAGNQDEARRDQTLVYKMKARLNQTLVYKMKARLDQTLVYKMKARLDQTLVMLQSLNLNQFTTTAYPNVQENLKQPTEDQVILEEPASSIGTLFSLQNLEKELSFTYQFFVEKS